MMAKNNTNVRRIDYLAVKASGLLADTAEDSRAELLHKLLFGKERWESALGPFLQVVRHLSLAITNPLGGCIFLASSSPTEANTTYDVDGFSTLLRMALFSLRFVAALQGVAVLAAESQVVVVHYLLLVQELVKDNLTVPGSNDLWAEHSEEVEAEMVEFSSEVQQWVFSVLRGDTTHAVPLAVVERLTEGCGGADAASFFAARALSSVLSELWESDPFFREKAVAWAESTDVWKSPDVIRCVGMLTASIGVLTQSKKERVWNGIINTVLGVSFANAANTGLRLLVLLNAALPDADEGTASIPQPRAMFLVKHLLSWVDEDNEDIEFSPGLIVEIAKALESVLPVVKGMYGEHWQGVLNFIRDCWEGSTALDEFQLPMVASTLRVFQVVKGLKEENEDLEEAWEEGRDGLYSRLIQLLLKSGRPDTMHQPRAIVNTQIARQLRDIDVGVVEDLGAVYSLLGTQARAIQTAAFDILHRYIPTTQEQLSIDTALEKELVVQLPSEILSLIISAPVVPLDLELPIPLRSYILSWLLVFDHFQNAVSCVPVLQMLFAHTWVVVQAQVALC
jgi:hypothetical protein